MFLSFKSNFIDSDIDVQNGDNYDLSDDEESKTEENGTINKKLRRRRTAFTQVNYFSFIYV